MKRLIGGVLALLFVAAPAVVSRADDKDPNAILDRAIKAIGGEEKIAKAEAISWKTKGTITFNGNESDMESHAISKGLGHYRTENEMNGGERKFVTVLAGDKGWRKFGDEAREMEADALANQKRTAYLAIVPVTLVPLKGKDFKLEAAGEKDVDGKPAVGIKATGPDGKDFTLYFDKESGLPVKLVAQVVGFQGNEFTMETTYKDYKDFDGIKSCDSISNRKSNAELARQRHRLPLTSIRIHLPVDHLRFPHPPPLHHPPLLQLLR